MQSLAAGDFPKVLPLVHTRESGGHLALICSVLEGRWDGMVFVDDPVTPRTALVMAHQKTLLANWTFLLGDPANGSFQRFVPQLLSEYLPSVGATLFPTTSAGREALDALLYQNTVRAVFHWPSSVAPWKPERTLTLPVGLTLEAMHASDPDRYGAILDPATGFGFCLMHEGRWVSQCYSEWVGGGEAEITIATRGEFQRQGLATFTGRAFIQECLARNLRPAWSCDNNNVASLATARKLGFLLDEEMPGYYIHAAFLWWRDPERGTYGPAPYIDVAGYDEPSVMEMAQTLIREALDHQIAELELIPDPEGVHVRCGEGANSKVLEVLPQDMQMPLTAQFKAMTGMNLTKQGIRQAGRCALRHREKDYTMRIRVDPSAGGERITLRLEENHPLPTP